LEAAGENIVDMVASGCGEQISEEALSEVAADKGEHSKRGARGAP